MNSVGGSWPRTAEGQGGRGEAAPGVHRPTQRCATRSRADLGGRSPADRSHRTNRNKRKGTAAAKQTVPSVAVPKNYHRVQEGSR